MTHPGPKALQPSNTTQAQASTATQIGLTAASLVLPGLGEEAGVAGAARGMSEFGGIMASETNAAGGTLVTFAGGINQADVAGAVNSAMYSGGDINILTGVHGLPDGTMIPDASFFQADQAAFGGLPGVSVQDISTMSDSQISNTVNGPGTTIGAFCNSSACLAH
jgi:hypothetical protein